jgi:hypothetical protein
MGDMASMDYADARHGEVSSIRVRMRLHRRGAQARDFLGLGVKDLAAMTERTHEAG